MAQLAGDRTTPGRLSPVPGEGSALDEDAVFQALVAKESTCLRCGRSDIEIIICLESCDHRFCRTCLRSNLTRDDADYQHRIVCPQTGCNELVPAYIYRQVLGPSECQALEAMGLEAVLSSNAFIRCPSCHERFEKQPGKVLGRNQDSVRSIDGSEMTAAALKHRALHRFRCPCGSDFCDSCGSKPYHNGFNCDSYKTYSVSKFCRFCHAVITRRKPTGKFAALECMLARLLTLGVRSHPPEVCGSDECAAKINAVCKKILPCSHPCLGIARETKCLRCLKCPDQNSNVAFDEFCNICWVESLGSAPCIELRCGHVFHSSCVQQKLEKRWPGSRISFGFLSCPLCHKAIFHPSLASIVRACEKLRKDVTALAMKRLRVEQMTDHEKITTPGSRYFNQPEAFALGTFAFYQCFKCEKPYFGGKRECGDMVGLNEEQFDASELLCAKCSGSPSSCSVHGNGFIEYKCRYCCQVAVWFCWGNTHFCDHCHGKRPTTFPACPGAARCPLGVDHPPNGKEFSLGCALCRRGRERPVPVSNSPVARTRSRVEIIDLEDEKPQQQRRQRLRDSREVVVLD